MKQPTDKQLEHFSFLMREVGFWAAALYARRLGYVAKR
jgi:hypothetical protein